MEAYWLLFGSGCLGLFLSGSLRREHDVLLFRLVFLEIVLLVGLRHQVGGDWVAYEDYFYRYAQHGLHDVLLTTKDPGYFLLGWLIARFGGDVHLLNLGCAVVFSLGLYRFCRSQAMPWLAVLIGIPYLVVVVAMGYTRQSVAIGLVLIGLSVLREERILGYMMLVAVAAAFHRSAIVMLPLAALVSQRGKVLTFLSVLATGFTLAYVLIGEQSEVLVRGYVESEYSAASAGGVVRVLMIAVPAAFYLLMRGKMDDPGALRRIWRALAIGAILSIPMLFISITATDRLALYLVPLQIHVLSGAPVLVRSVYLRPVGVAAVVILMFFVQFTWLNFAVNAGSWIPYRNVLFELL